MELVVGLLIAFALLVIAVVLLSRGGQLKPGTLPNGQEPNARNGQYNETWASTPMSVPNGTEGTFTFTVSFDSGGSSEVVKDREYIFVVQPRENLTIVTANGAAVNADSATVLTDEAGKVELVIRTDAPSEASGGVLAGRTTQQIRQALHKAVFTIPDP